MTATILNDILGDHLDFAIDLPPALLPQIKAGKVRALAIEGAQRSPLLPDVPTFDELGHDRVPINGGWHALLAPGGTPRPIIERLHAALIDGLRKPAIRDDIAADGGLAVGNSPDEFRAFLARESARLREIARLAGIGPN